MYKENDEMNIFVNDEFEPLYGKNDKVKGRLDDRLKKTSFGGYTKSSVEQFALEVTEESEQMKANFEKQIRDISAECSQLSSECSVLRKQIQQAETEKKDVMKELDSVRKEKAELEKKIEDEFSSSDEQSNKIIELSNTLEEREELIEKYKEISVRLKYALYAANDKTEELNKVIAGLKKSASESAAYKEEAERLRNSVAELEKLKAAYAELSEEHQNMKQSYEGGDELQKQLGIYQEKIDDLEEKYAKLYEQYRSSIGKAEQLSAEKDAIERLLKKYQIREQELAVLRDDNSELREIALELKETLDVMLHEMEKQSAEYKKLSEQLEQKIVEISRLNGQKSELQIKNVRLLERIEAAAKEQTSLAENNLRVEWESDENTEEAEAEHEAFTLYSIKNKDIDKADTNEFISRARQITENYSA